MGTWGSGDFENDGAADHLIEIWEPMIEQIRDTVKKDEFMEPDEYSSEVMLANIKILAILAENIGRSEKDFIGAMVFPFPYPESSEINDWKNKY